MLTDLRVALVLWLEATPAGDFVNAWTWAWPIAESAHFIGLCLLVGTVGLFDLRLIGFVRSISLPTLHRMIPWGVAGFAINILTGSLFLAAAPYQYLFNTAFYFKVAFLTVGGINIAIFYSVFFRRIRQLGPGESAPLGARIIGGVSLLVWVGVMTAGRLLTFYRPGYRFF
jgi:hypothetical protein